MISFYLGGARSGKSGLAEAWIKTNCSTEAKVTYVATARPYASMEDRIALHKAQRPSSWLCIEEPLELAHLLETTSVTNKAISEIDNEHWIIIDCLTLWLTNHMMNASNLKHEINSLCHVLSKYQGDSDTHIILVSTEVGLGLIPEDDMSQEFVIASGALQQAVAAVADRVVFCQSGLPISLKGLAQRGPHG